MTNIPNVLNVIGGEAVPGSTGDFIDVFDPATGEVVAHVTRSNREDVMRAVEAASTAQKSWGAVEPAERTRILNAVADALEHHLSELIDLEVSDTGKPITAISEDEFPGVVEAVRQFANGWRTLSGSSGGEFAPGATTFLKREPVGVVSAITPWNYPLWQALWKIIPAIATGNTVVVKPSEVTPQSTTRFVEIMQEFLPRGVVNVVNGRGSELGEELVSNEKVELVTFTGSTRVGRLIAQTAAARPKRTVMELGGNAPVVVLPDVDVADAAEKIAGHALWNAGQECMAASRIIVHESIADEFVAELKKHFEAAVVGDPRDPRTTVGPLTSREHLNKVADLVASGIEDGEVVTGGAPVGGSGYFFTPTIIRSLGQESRIVQEEVFGPVATVQTFRETESAIRMANDVEYGLAASVWTRSAAEGLTILHQLDFGNVWLNTHLALSPSMPIGGFKASGYGKEGGLLGMEEFTRVKQVALATE